MGKAIDKRRFDNVKTIIKVNRLLQGKSQREVCDGICTTSHLSKIEQGDTQPSREIIVQFYKKLGLNAELDEAFIENGYDDIVIFFKEFMFNEFDVTNKRFLNLEDDEEKYMASPFVLDYLIAKMSFCSTQNKKSYSDIKSILSTMTKHMSKDQKYYYYLCLGVVALKGEKDLKRTEQYFTRAKSLLDCGQINYWIGYMYLKNKQAIEASQYAERGLRGYFKDANIVGVISTFELLGLIYYSVSEYAAGIRQYEKALEYSRLAIHSMYEANIKNQIAWGYMRLGNYDKSKTYLVKDRYNSDNTVNSSVTKFVIAYLQKDIKTMHALKEEFSSRNRSLHRMIYSVLDRARYLDDDGKWIVEDSEIDALFEFAQFTHFELEKVFCEMATTHYSGKGDYKTAFQYAKKATDNAFRYDTHFKLK